MPREKEKEKGSWMWGVNNIKDADVITKQL